MAQIYFFICKTEEEGVAMATTIGDNTADEKSGKSLGQVFIKAQGHVVPLLYEQVAKRIANILEYSLY